MTFVPSDFEKPAPHRTRSETAQAWSFLLLLAGALSVLGWSYLAAMIADMIPSMDMAEAGPGMGLFNTFNLFNGVPAEARAALASLCLPTSATFGMPSQAMTALDLLKVFLMWGMMSIAMMVPTALPMLRAYFKALVANGNPGKQALLPSAAALIGYLTVWLGYALAATCAQWALHKAGGLTDMMAPASLALTTSVLFAAGLYQFTSAKRACLARCWYPRWVFAPSEDRTPASAGYAEGLVQGWACLGCCWAVMTVMFAVGLMNVLWIAILGLIMAFEKALPSRALPLAIGIFLLLWSGFLAASIYF